MFDPSAEEGRLLLVALCVMLGGSAEEHRLVETPGGLEDVLFNRGERLIDESPTSFCTISFFFL
jgi:hypothetical protein